MRFLIKEQRTHNPLVDSSSLGGPTKNYKRQIKILQICSGLSEDIPPITIVLPYQAGSKRDHGERRYFQLFIFFSPNYLVINKLCYVSYLWIIRISFCIILNLLYIESINRYSAIHNIVRITCSCIS